MPPSQSRSSKGSRSSKPPSKLPSTTTTTPFRAVIINDLQVPLHDPDAVDVAQQIARDFRPEVLDLNGDIFDLLGLSRWPSAKSALNEKTIIELDSEIERGIRLVKAFVKEVRPARVHWKNGNHEWRLLRVIAQADSLAKKILELRVVRNSYAYPELFQFDQLSCPVVFAGEYPKGLWLHPCLPPEKNCWIEHGYVVRKKSGFTASALMDERCSSVITGHCEKLALVWRHINGDRNWFGIENGNLSLIGVPGQGDGLYSGVPHSEPDYINHQQGLTTLTYVDGEWWPELVRIHRGKALWRGKLYASRLKKS